MKFALLSSLSLATLNSGIAAAFTLTRRSPGASSVLTTSSFPRLFVSKDIDTEAPDIIIQDIPRDQRNFFEVFLPPGILLTGGEKLREEGLFGTGVKVGVIDDGIDTDHWGFDDKAEVKQWYRGGPLGGHGTHVAGTIHMMAPGAEIYDYRVIGGSRVGPLVRDPLVDAIDKAVADGCNIINMSLSSRPRIDLERSINEASEKGVIVVCAAGNSGDNDPLTNEFVFPASYSKAISVAAVSKKNGLPTAKFSSSNFEVDYAGIGVDVWSFRNNGRFIPNSGTSMACPHVCGFITALMTKGSAYEDIIQDDASLRKLLNEKFTIDIAVEGRDRQTGNGFLTYLDEAEFESAFSALPDHAVLAP